MPRDRSTVTRRRLAALTGLALALVASGAWWLAGARSRAAPGASSVAPEKSSRRAPAAALATEGIGAGALAPAASARSLVSSTPDEHHDGSASPASASELVWLRGHLVLPPGTPWDERVRVVPSGSRRGWASGDPTEGVAVAADGSFRIAFARGTRVAALTIAARYVRLREPVRVALATPSPAVVLEPELGARVIARVALPAGGAPEDLERVRVTAMRTDDPSAIARSVEGVATSEPPHAFELGALDAGAPIEIDVRSTVHCGESRAIEALAPGETRVVDFALRAGVRVRGRVIDEDGNGVANAELDVHRRLRSGGLSVASGSRADDAGCFDLRGIEPDGQLTLVATRRGHLRAEVELGELGDGAVRSGIELRLSSGSSVQGVVLWPDGRPAARATVEIATDETALSDAVGASIGVPFRASDATTTTTDDHGRFEASGLECTHASIRARARPEPATSSDEPGGRARRPAHWHASIENAPVGRDVELVLREGHTIRGRVVDDTGAPIERFRVRARGDDAAGVWSLRSVASEMVRTADGAFALAGVPEGVWTLTVEADDHASVERTAVQVPGTAELVLVIPRTGTVRGFVRDANGEAIANARVTASRVGHEVAGAETEGLVRPWERSAGSADGNGEYALELAPGTYTLRAHASGRAPGETSEIVVTPAEVIDDVCFALRPAARIHGRIAASGAPLASFTVRVRSMPESTAVVAQLDADGRFDFDHLDAGTYVVSAHAEHDLAGDSEPLAEQEIVVAEGEVREVVLEVSVSDPRGGR